MSALQCVWGKIINILWLCGTDCFVWPVGPSFVSDILSHHKVLDRTIHESDRWDGTCFHQGQDSGYKNWITLDGIKSLKLLRSNKLLRLGHIWSSTTSLKHNQQAIEELKKQRQCLVTKSTDFNCLMAIVLVDVGRKMSGKTQQPHANCLKSLPFIEFMSKDSNRTQLKPMFHLMPSLKAI
jgi:hypothetical protein